MYYVGVDIGGTNIAVGIVDKDLKIIAKNSRKTELPCSQEDFCDDVAATINETLDNLGLKAEDVIQIGIGCPGTANAELGTIEFANNLGYRDFPIVSLISAKFPNMPVKLANDANCAAYGEFKAGALRNVKMGVAVTLGTGVGGGIIIDGKLYTGFNFAGAELGHTVIKFDGRPCNCGRVGCWERYASANALTQTTKEFMENEKNSIMWDMVEGDIEKVSARTAFNAMKEGDALGKKVVDEYINHLCVGLSDVINTFQPEVLCIGGGVSGEGETLLVPVREVCAKSTYIASKQTRICKAELGNDAGIIGAALIDL